MVERMRGELEIIKEEEKWEPRFESVADPEVEILGPMGSRFSDNAGNIYEMKICDFENNWLHLEIVNVKDGRRVVQMKKRQAELIDQLDLPPKNKEKLKSWLIESKFITIPPSEIHPEKGILKREVKKGDWFYYDGEQFVDPKTGKPAEVIDADPEGRAFEIMDQSGRMENVTPEDLATKYRPKRYERFEEKEKPDPFPGDRWFIFEESKGGKIIPRYVVINRILEKEEVVRYTDEESQRIFEMKIKRFKELFNRA
jgi:hypothetical protein